MVEYRDILQEVLVGEEQLQTRIHELGAQISKDYAGKDLLLLCILRGGVMFLTDLMRRISIPHAIDFMAISSYGVGARSSTGNVRISLDLNQSIENRHVLVVEDIVDTGHTIAAVLELLATRRPASLKICALLDKSERREVPVPIHYIGFDIPNKFVFGYGLDVDELYRNLPFVGVVKPDWYLKPPSPKRPDAPLARPNGTSRSILSGRNRPHRDASICTHHASRITPPSPLHPLHMSDRPPPPPALAEIHAALPPDLPIWLVGGALRDAWLRRPIHDLDFAVDGDGLAGRPPRGRRPRRRLLPARRRAQHRPRHRRAGLAEDLTLDFARMRGSDLATDLALRDFTLNAMAAPLAAPEDLIDPLNGQDDLRHRVVRACTERLDPRRPCPRHPRRPAGRRAQIPAGEGHPRERPRRGRQPRPGLGRAPPR